ncbi:MAG: SWIM zinc finger family protein, partial [Treponema sp.]|nr:SWIM zinc finger family protein [Treponema sp.]
MKNRYGVTPWGSWFIDILDSYQMGVRLDRGRRYANTGRVLSLEFNAGRAIAKVEGNYLPSYRVEISFPPLKEAEQVYRMIEEDLPLLARIAAGELPETFLQKLKDKGINLIPRRWREMQRSCTCPDWGDPCKHMAALYYIIAREIDSDPHVLFKLRGIDLAARFGSAAVHNIMPPFTITFAPKKKDGEVPIQAPLELETIPHCGSLITSLLPPAPPFCNKDFALVMAEFYHRCAHDQAAWGSAVDERSQTVKEHNFSRSHWSVLCPNAGPGAEPVLQAEDINGKKKNYSPYDAFEHFVHFSSEDGTASYTYLFYLFKFLNLVCFSGALIPYVLSEDKTLEIIWRPFEILPPVPQMLEAIALREPGMFTIPALNKNTKAAPRPGPTVSGRSVVDLLASAFLNEWVKRKFVVFRGSSGIFGGQGGDEYRELLNLFFNGTVTDITSPAKRSLPAAIDRWLSVLHTNFSAYRYSITVKDLSRNRKDTHNDASEVFDFALSMDVLVDQEEGTTKIPLSKCRDLEMLRAPIALSNYLPEIQELASPQMTRRQAVHLSEERLVSFLDSAASLLVRLGVMVNLPKSLHKELKPRLVITGNFGGDTLVHFLDLDTLQNFKWQIAIGDKVLDLAEFEKLVKEKRALVRFKDGFIK